MVFEELKASATSASTTVENPQQTAARDINELKLPSGAELVGNVPEPSAIFSRQQISPEQDKTVTSHAAITGPLARQLERLIGPHSEDFEEALRGVLADAEELAEV